MADIEFRLVSDRREGLLLELGRLIVASGFTLQRQRMLRTEEGVVLTMVVRGPESSLLMLEDRLGSHPLVQSFESGPVDPAQAAAASAAESRPRTAAEAAPADPSAPPDPARVEAVLTSLARDFPDIFSRVLAFAHELSPAHREASTRYVGTRLGAWIYKRDFGLGARFNLVESVRHIALPAMRQLLRDTDLSGDSLRIRSSPFTGINLHRGPSCHFLRGCLEGLLNEPGHLGRPRVLETFCRNTGADACIFTFGS